MTIEEKKISLIKWITNLEDEAVLDQLNGLQNNSLNQLPGAIVELLKMAEEEPEEKLILHTSARDILNRL